VDQIISPLILYGMIALGAIGVCLALPRKGKTPQVIGALVASLAAGGVILALTLKAGADHPNLFFYVFGIIALGSALRVITHSRPVYAALWFIMVVLASAGLLLILSAEFMAFALIIVYAGAILITYLFVIMLATQAPGDDTLEVLAQYDVEAREPIAATVVGFVLLAVLTTFMFRGLPQVSGGTIARSEGVVARMPRLYEARLRDTGNLKSGEHVVKVDVADRKLTIQRGGDTATQRTLEGDAWPADVRATNVQALGFNFMSEHPGTIEIAGVLLLMAMLGAVVLSRKQVQLDEDAKSKQAHELNLRRVLSDAGGEA
jgi:NADH-quinone oxidoreductase subunit J